MEEKESYDGYSPSQDVREREYYAHDILPCDEEVERREKSRRWLEENVAPEDRADYYARQFRLGNDGT